MDDRSLGLMFCNGDLDRRRRQLGQYFVLKQVRNHPVRAVAVYRQLFRWHGEHAAEVFREYLAHSDSYAWYHLVGCTRRALPIPG
jgi:hypothetical protein